MIDDLRGTGRLVTLTSARKFGLSLCNADVAANECCVYCDELRSRGLTVANGEVVEQAEAPQ